MKRYRKAAYHPAALVESPSVGKGTRVWAFAHIMKGATIGADGNVGDHSFIEGGARIGSRVTIKNGVSVWDGVTISDGVFIGPNAVFTNDLRPVSRSLAHDFKPTRVLDGAAVGANAVVVCGHTIGRFALVGAGTVVSRDVPDFALCYGNPGRVRGFVCVCREDLRFRGARARCRCGRTYRKTSGRSPRVTEA
ncbi:MAG: N-acetyltransferase [Candidatus Omnitrophica bacterium]|nr:N-acetyltransferase [Candidatus Omnitrophota bacterium]